ncbi:aminotransferase class IV [Longirhabdus pacifica]|uniref:aminotransferase class IV n=1 Tax=Longirhabdus pacifica TaxID=2305227 RepID=UPI001009364E|nr:aminotransferase class IV [Longirhabdus pacifica]
MSKQDSHSFERGTSFQLLETMLLQDGSIFLLSYHVKRLLRSAQQLQFSIKESHVMHSIQSFISQYKNGRWRVRLVADVNGHIDISGSALTMSHTEEAYTVALAKEPIDKHDLFLHYKTTNRTIYEYHIKQFPSAFDVLLWNEQEQLTEFTIGNIVLQIDGVHYTPPRHCGLLAGTYREYLLEQGQLSEKVLYKHHLEQATHMWLLNSVRKWVPVKLDSPDSPAKTF